MRRLLPLLALLALAPAAAAQEAPVDVEVGLLVLNLGNYDVTKGTYLADFYLWMRWNPGEAPEGFTPERFEFMNGRATAKERLHDEVLPSGAREVWWRIQASLYAEPRFESYPYDTQHVVILIEDAVHPAAELRYVALAAESGLDDEARVAGWRVQDVAFGTASKEYSFGETYDRLTFRVTLFREPLSTTLKAFLPPFAFVVVSGLSFLFHPQKVAQRLALGTGMLISAVGFHISQTVALPPLSQLILFDKVMISVYAFLSGSLVVTTLIAIDEDWWKDRDHTGPINRWGAAATILLPFVVFGLLSLV